MKNKKIEEIAKDWFNIRNEQLKIYAISYHNNNKELAVQLKDYQQEIKNINNFENKNNEQSIIDNIMQEHNYAKTLPKL